MEAKKSNAKPADLAPHLIGTKGKVDRPSPKAAQAHEPLTFKVPSELKRRFRHYAAEHDMRLNQVLARAMDALERETKGKAA